MKAIVPVTVLDTMLVSSSIPEDDAPPFDAEAVYAIGDTCIDDHLVYSSLVASNAGKLPSVNLTGSTPAWSLVGSTNRWKQYDEYSNSRTVSQDGSPLVDVLDVSYCNAIALFGLVGESLQVTVQNSQGDVVFEKDVDLIVDDNVLNWEDYFYASRYFLDVCWLDIPIMTSARITRTLKGASPSCGNCIIGEARFMGNTQYGLGLPVTDYSVFSTNDFGGVYLSKGAIATNPEGDVVVESGMVRSVLRVRNELLATPTAFFLANEEHPDGLHEVMIVYGVLRNFEPTIERPTENEFSFKITGVK